MYKLLMGILLIINLVTVNAKTIYLSRHAEKVGDGSKDPALTEQGQERANNLAKMLSTAKIEHIYSTNYRRTQLTAKPLADFLGIEVKIYNPRDLNAFAEILKQQQGNAWVVGHSNTTPMLTYLLSDQATFSLDEVDFDNLFQVVFGEEKTTLNVLKSLPTQATQTLSQFKPLTTNYFEGDLTFDMLFKGEKVGQSIHQFRQEQDTYELKELTQIERMGIDATIQVTVNANDLAPKQLSMKGHVGAPVDISLNWQKNQVTGHTDMQRELFKKQGRIDLDTSFPEGTLERTSSIMLAHLLPVKPSVELLIQWFNGYDGSTKLVNVIYHGEEKITVPAGTFDTYKIEYSGGAPSQYYWIDKKAPKLVKIKVIHSPWSYELSDIDLNL